MTAPFSNPTVTDVERDDIIKMLQQPNCNWGRVLGATIGLVQNHEPALGHQLDALVTDYFKESCRLARR